MAEADWGPIRSFGVDNGELDGLSPHQIFVLGYELALIDEALKLPEGISKPVRADNRQRIESECKRLNRPFTLSWMEEDMSEEWLWLEVPPT